MRQVWSFYTPLHLNFVTCDCRCSFERKLKDCCSGSADEVGPQHRVNVGGVRVFVGGILLSLTFSVLRVVKLHQHSLDSVAIFLNSN